MDYKTACRILNEQERNLRKINNVRFTRGEYEYRLTYMGGFAAYVGIDRRKIGKRKFEYFGGFGAYDCANVGEAMNVAYREVEKRGA